MEQLNNKVIKEQEEKNIRYLIKYTKESNIKFIAHLDLMRTAQKIVRRAKLPVKYSKGFNPHMAMSIAQPLAVGMYSAGEYMDLVFVEEVDEKEIIDRLNACTASGIKFISAKKIVNVVNQKKVPQAMALFYEYRYTIKIKYDDTSNLENEIKNLLNKEMWKALKKSKKTEKEIDIKALVYDFKYWIKDNFLILNVLLQSGSREHLSAEFFTDYIKNNTTKASDYFVDIKREEMYYNKNGKLEPIYKISTNI